MTRPKTSIAEQLNAANIAINNAQNDPEIMTALARFNFGSEAFAEGRQFHTDALRAFEEQQDARGRQRQAAAELLKAKDTARIAYQALAQISRQLLSKADQVRLGLTGKMPASTAGRLIAAQTLFDNARLEDMQPLLAERGYNRLRLDHEYAIIVAFDTANQAHTAAKGAAQHATQMQRKALATLRRWMGQLRSTARVALLETPQLLETLGFIAPNGPSAAQRRARSEQNGETNEPPSDEPGEESEPGESETPASS